MNQAIQNFVVAIAHLRQADLPAEAAELLLKILFLRREFSERDVITADGCDYFAALRRLERRGTATRPEEKDEADSHEGYESQDQHLAGAFELA